MSSTNTNTITSTSSGAAQPTGNNEPFQGSTPPLLPAFLITGLLLAAIVAIIVWRHLLERRSARLEGEDPTWPGDGLGAGGGGSGARGPTPKLWELAFASESARTTWGDIMPLSVVPLRSPPKPCRPRFLVPSDRPLTFLQRMFGGARRAPIPIQAPATVLQPISSHPSVNEQPIDRLQVAVLISLPHPHRPRRASCLHTKRASDVPSFMGSLKEESEAESSKGKKRSLDTPLSMLKGYYDYDDEEGPLEVAFGTAVLPYEDEGRAGC